MVNDFARHIALAPLLLAACAGTPPVGAGGPPAPRIAAPAPSATADGGVPAGGEAEAAEPRLTSGTRAFPVRVYTRDAVVTLFDPELTEDPAGLSLRVGVDVYLDEDRARHAGRATVPASRRTGAGQRSLLDWRAAEARFEFDGAGAGAEPALIAAAGLALARQPARFCLERCTGDPALRVLAPAATHAPAAGPAGPALGNPLVPLEQARARELRRRAAVEARQRALTTDPRIVPPAASGRYFGRPGRLGPVLGLPGGLGRGGIGRR